MIAALSRLGLMIVLTIALCRAMFGERWDEAQVWALFVIGLMVEVIGERIIARLDLINQRYR